MYIKCIDDNMIIFTYVDDMLFLSNTKAMLSELKDHLLGNFDMKDFEDARFILGMEIKRD